MQTPVKTALILALLATTGCQTLNSSSSTAAAPAASTGTPLSEILARANGLLPKAKSEPSASTVTETPAEQTQLSIGLNPAPKTEVEVSERSTTAKVTDTHSQPQPPAIAAETAQPATAPSDAAQAEATQPVTAEAAPADSASAEPSSAEPAAVASAAVPNHPPTISEQLNWLPSLDETLVAMDSSVSDSATLDDKIDALMSLAYVIDAKLYISFRELLDRVSPDEGALLMAEQQEWLTQRKENLTRAYLEFKADKAGRYNAAQAFLRNSHTRMREIDARLAGTN